VPVIDVSTRLTGRRWISLPYTDFCPPLSVGAAPLDQLARELDLERREAGIGRLELRYTLAGPNVARRSEFVLHRLQLEPDPDSLFRRIRSGRRREITSARRQGVTVTHASRRSELVDTFYALHLQSRRRQGVPIQPRRFFELFWERIIEPGLGFCILAFAHGSPVAGAVCLAWNGTVTGKYAAFDRRFSGLQANQLVQWEQFAWACVNGFREFDMGRTDLDNAGLRAFKSSWRAVEEPLVYSALGDAPSAHGNGRGRALLGTIIRHSPASVCQLTGKLLYKYAS